MTMIDQLSAILLLSILILAPLDAKKIGKDVFSCSPTSFTFGLNLNGKCPGMIEARPGIDGSDCYFIEDLTSIPTPVSVTQIQILELNLDLLTIYAKTLDGEFDDGYSWEYTSITAGELTDETELPGGIQLNIQGVDSNGIVVTNSIIIDYSNTADAYPILKIGDEIGWIVIVSCLPSLVSPSSDIFGNSPVFVRWIWLPLVLNIVPLPLKHLSRIFRIRKHR